MRTRYKIKNQEHGKKRVRDFKKYTAKKCVEPITNNGSESRKNRMLWMFRSAGKKKSNNKNYQFWRQDTHPIELDSNEMMDQKLEYIHNNLAQEGIVDNPADYLYSSARNYEGLEGLIKVTLLE